MSLEQHDRLREVSAMFCSTEMSPVERGEWGRICHFEERSWNRSSVALGQHFTDPPHAHSGLTGELVALTQEQLRERHVPEGRDVTWWDKRGRCMRTAEKVPRPTLF